MKKDIFYSKEEANNFYQGWSNWHTWIINLWLNNDETLYSAFKHKQTIPNLKKIIKMAILGGTIKESNHINLNVVKWGEIVKRFQA